jgi:hypothetical protein
MITERQGLESFELIGSEELSENLVSFCGEIYRIVTDATVAVISGRDTQRSVRVEIRSHVRGKMKWEDLVELIVLIQINEVQVPCVELYTQQKAPINHECPRSSAIREASRERAIPSF